MSKITVEASRKLPPATPIYRDEPTPTSAPEGLTSGQLLQALRWYNENMSPEKVAGDGVASDTANRFYTYFKCKRLIARGFVLPHQSQASYLRLEQSVADFEKAKVESTTEKLSKPKVDIQAATAAKAMTHLEKIEVEFDRVLQTMPANESEEGQGRDVNKMDLYEFMRKLDIPGMHIPHIIKQIESDKKTSAYPKLWAQVIEDLEKLQKSAVTKRAPRKKKSLNVEKVVSKLSFLKEDTKLKITSVNPEKIIGAQELWTFMTDRRYVSHYVADGPAGLSIKGSTIHGFNVEKSLRKKLRKPEDFLKLLDGRSSKARKELDKLTTKTKEISGRVSENTLLVKVG